MKQTSKRFNRQKSRIGAAFAAPGVLGLLLFFLLPLVISLYFAFYESGQGFGFGNFQRVFTSTAFQTAFWNTWRLLALCMALLLSLSLTFALLLTYLKKTNPRTVFWFLSIQLLPIAIPSSVTGLFVDVLLKPYGIVNGILTAGGGTALNFLNSGLSFWVLVVIYMWKNIGLAVLLFYARINAIPKEIVEASKIDGAGVLRRTFSIMMPLIKSAFLFVSVVGVWGVFKVARESYLIFGNYPNISVYGLQNFLNNHFQSASYSVLSAASTIFFVVISIILLVPLAFDRGEG